jgi:hypothetical protein
LPDHRKQGPAEPLRMPPSAHLWARVATGIAMRDLRLFALMACVPFGTCSCAGSVGPEYNLSKPTQIMCEAGADCDAKWARANTWVTENSGLKIQTKTESQIKTVQSTADSRILVVTITKNATSKPGVYEISFIGGCPSPLSCRPPIAESRAQFAKFVLAAQ